MPFFEESVNNLIKEITYLLAEFQVEQANIFCQAAKKLDENHVAPGISKKLAEEGDSKRYIGLHETIRKAVQVQPDKKLIKMGFKMEAQAEKKPVMPELKMDADKKPVSMECRQKAFLDKTRSLP